MSDLVGNPEDQFSHVVAHLMYRTGGVSGYLSYEGTCHKNEPPHGKTNNVVSEQVGHKPGCTSTEDG